MSNTKTKKKLKVAIVALTSCEGEQFVMFDQGEEFLKLTEFLELSEFKLFEEVEAEPRYFDIAFVEGGPLSKEDLERLKEIRGKSKLLIAIGSCAVLGGIPEMKNYVNKDEKIKYVYQYTKHINNVEVKPLREIVKVDYEIPGCPMDGKEFLRIVKAVRKGVFNKIPERPVCFECQTNNYKCLLLDGKPCLGPITKGGCDAVCLYGGYQCEGCRGPLDNVNLENHQKLLLKNISKRHLSHLLELYGIKDDILENQRKEK
ncbi:NADH:ubiquinone oxidoreductase [Patescibacteria group bacterium]|nr:NADH:ubiquinone oxidoreductase [Patescibacteria group bacterium]